MTNALSAISELRDKGFKVFVEHHRYLDGNLFSAKDIIKMGQGMRSISPQGGRTNVVIYDADGNTLASAYADCSIRDNYNKATGRAIALGRALKSLRSAL